MATPQHIAEELLSGYTNAHVATERLTSTVVFSSPSPPFRQARLLLNERWGEGGRKVLHIHAPTNLHPAPGGQHFVVATLVGNDAIEPNPKEIQEELISWFGSQVSHWTHVLTTKVRYALPHIDPNHHARTLPELEFDGVYVVGDHRTHPSVQGALASAERLLKHFEIPFPQR